MCDLTHANGSQELLQLADGALYWAKSQGRDTVVVYSPEAVYELSDSDRADRLQRLQALMAMRSLARSIDARSIRPRSIPSESPSSSVDLPKRPVGRRCGSPSWPRLP